MQYTDLSVKKTDSALVSLRRTLSFGCALAPFMLLPATTYAAPEGGVVAHGVANIAQSGNLTTITQGTDRAVLDWQKFNLSKDESARFIQPNANSVAVNRIHDVNPSEINGALTANGTVMLVNPNGVFFGADAKVDVGGLIASTASPTDIDAKNWAEGKRNDLPLTVAGMSGAQILNAGTITAKEAGLVGLVAPKVENSGIIRATKGRVQLASGDTATLDLYGDGLVSLAVDQSVREQLVNQRGMIEADGGTVLLTAAAGQTVAEGVIKMDGVIQAHSIDGAQGKIILSAAGANGTGKAGESSVEVTGTLDVSGDKGGSITVTGDAIALKPTAVLNASGTLGGGQIRVGGDYQGAGTLSTARRVTVEQGASLQADALKKGDGGRVIVWSDKQTHFLGAISAKGGAEGGNGGFAETSGKETLRVTGAVDLRDSQGNAGTWLLDPTNITIYNRSAGGTDNINTFTTAYLEAQSASANISLVADNNIVLNLIGDTLTLAANRNISLAATSGSITTTSAGTVVASGTGAINLIAGTDINLSQNLSFVSGSGAITLRAARSISYTGQGDITTAGGAIILNADSDATNGGAISIGGDTRLSSGGGNITLGGGADPTTGYAISTSSHGIILADNGTGTLSPTINAGGGNIIMNGMGWQDASATSASGLRIKGATISTTASGNITLNGIGGGTSATTTNNSHGVYLYKNTDGAAPSVIAQNGVISITGSTVEASTTPSGAVVIAEGVVQTTGTGNIVLTANNALSTMRGLLTSSFSSLTSGGSITYIGDNLDSANYQALWNASGDIIIRPYTAGTTVGIGSGAGVLSISNNWLGKFTYGGTLWLGGYGLTGAEPGYWNSAGLMTINSTRSFANSVNFLSGNNIVSGGAGTLAFTGSASTTFHALGDINFSHDFDLTTTGTGGVTLRANGNIVSTASGDITTNGGAIVLNSDRDANSDGAISLGSGTLLTSNGGNITLGGGANPATGSAYGNASYVQGVVLTSALLDAQGISVGGSIIANGTGWTNSTANTATTSASGVLVNQSNILTNYAGAVDINGVAGGVGLADFLIGTFLYNDSSINVVNGSINVSGTGGAVGAYKYGVILSSVGVNTINSTGFGSINVVGRSNGGAVAFNSINGGIFSKNGDVTVVGISSAGNGILTNPAVGSRIIGGSNATGRITLITDGFSLGSIPVVQTTGDVVIRPYTTGTTVGVGGGVGALGIYNTLLDNITAGTLWLGGYGLTGAEPGYWNSAGLMTINSTRSFANNVNFLSGNNIVSGGAGTLTFTGAASTIFHALGEINFSHDLDLTASGTGAVTLRANANIVYSGSGDITTNGGAIVLNSDRDANSDGAISLGTGTELTSNGGNITLGGGANPATTAAYGNATYENGLLLSGSSLNSGSGNIILNGNGYLNHSNSSLTASGVKLSGAQVTATGAGTITMVGQGGATGSAAGHGIFLISGSAVNAQNGNITLTGTGTIGSTGQGGHGIAISTTGVNTINSTGTGNITLMGAGGASGTVGPNHGVVFNSVGGGIFSKDGSVSITGTPGYGGSGIFGVSGAVIGGANATGIISLITNSLSSSAVAGIQTTGDVIIRPYTAGTTVGIGSGAGTLSITDAFLNSITAGTLWLGGYGLTGAESGYWNSAGLMTINSTRSFANNVNFLSGNNIASGGAGTLTFTGAAGTIFHALGDINFSHDFDLTASGTGAVTLRANGNIVYSGSGDITTNGGAIVLNSDRDANSNGFIGLGIGTAFVSNGGNITLGGGLNPLTDYAYANPSHGVSVKGTLDSGSGAISIRGKNIYANAASYGVYMVSSTVTSTSGNITVDAVNTATSNNHALMLDNSTIHSTSGNIMLTGDSDSSQYDVVFWQSSAIHSDSGAVQLNAAGAILFSGGGTALIGDATSSGLITIATDRIQIGSSAYSIRSTGDVVLRPYTAGTTVGIGSGAGTLGITDSILNNVSAGGTLWLGGYGLTGAEPGYWNSAGLMTINSTRSFANNVNFLSGNNIVSGGAGTLTFTGAASTLFHALGDINITHDFDLTVSGTGSVTERAGGNIYYSASGDITTNGGAIVLNADRDANGVGAIRLNTGTALISNGGDITLGGGANPLTTAAYGNGASFPRGIILDTAILNASGTSSGGNITLRGIGDATVTSGGNASGVEISTSNIITNFAGNVSVYGTGGAASSIGGRGVYLVNNGTISAQNGNVTLVGYGSPSQNAPAADGVVFSGSGANSITLTGSGSVFITGTGSSHASATNTSYGVFFGSTIGGIYTTTGSVVVNGIQGANLAVAKGFGGNAGFVIGNASTSGLIDLRTDNINWVSPPVLQTTGDVVIRPYTAGTTVGIGSGAGTLNIANAFLNNITAGTLWLGGYGLTGAEAGYWNSAGLMTINSTRSFANNVNFLSGNNIVSGGAGTLTFTGAASTIFHALGDINFSHDLSLTASGTGTITERANGNIIYTGGGDITTNGTAIILNSDRDANNDGAISLGSGTVLTSNGGSITLGGGSNPATGYATGNATYLQGVNLTASTVTAGGGNIIVNGKGYAASTSGGTGADGVYLLGGILRTASNGTITVNGQGGSTSTGFGRGIFLNNSGLVEAVNGAILMNGTGGAGSGDVNYGVGFSGASGTNSVSSLGSGAITIHATGGTGSGNVNHGFLLNTASGGIFSSAGDITITALAGSGSSFAVYTTAANRGTIGGASASGKITLIANAGLTTNLSPVIQTTGDVIIRPYTAGTTVGIGTGAGTLNIADTLLSNITAGGTVWIGGYGATGAETGYWNSAGNVAVNTALGSIANNLAINSAGKITTSSGITMASGKSLTLTADDMTIGGALTGNGQITIQQSTLSRQLTFNNRGDDGTSLNWGATEIGYLTDGWSMINLGNTAGTSRMYLGVTNSTTATFTDNLTLRHGSGGWNQINRVALTGGANLTVLGSVDFNQSLTTDGGSIAISSALFGFNSAGIISTNGGAFSVGSGLRTWDNGSGAIINTAGGNITIGGNSFMQGTPSGTRSYTLNAGSGAISFGGTVNLDGDISATGNSISFNGAWGGTNPVGNVTLTSVNSLTLPTITTQAGKTVSATVTGAGNSITSGVISTGTGGNITLTADDLTIGGNLSGTGTITLQSYSAGRNTCINYTGGVCASNAFSLDSTELSRIVDGWNEIIIGDANNSTAGQIYLGAASWNDSLKLRAADKTLYGAQTFSAGSNFTSLQNKLDLKGYSVTLNGGNVLFSNNFVSNGATVTTNGGSFTQNVGTLYSDYGNFTVNTAGGNISLGTIDRSGPNNYGTLTFNAGSGTVTAGGTINGAVDLSVTGSTITMNNAIGGTTAVGNVTVNGTSNIGLGAITTIAGKTINITTTGAGSKITSAGMAVGAAGNINLTADNMDFTGALSGTGTLTIRPNSTSRKIYVGYGTDDGTVLHLSTTDVNNIADGWGAINIGRSDNSQAISIGTTSWKDPVNFISSNGGTGILIASAMTGTDNAAFSFTSAGITWNDSITTAGGAVSFTGPVYTMNKATPFAITTNGGNISFSSTLAGTQAVTQNIAMNAGTGNVSFGGTVNSFNGTNPLNITASGNAISFNGAWGGTNGVGDVSLTAVNSVTLPAITTQAGKTVSATVSGAGNSITTSTISTGTAGNITLTADDVAINGNLSGTGILTLRPYDTVRYVRVNNGTDDGSAFYLNTTELTRFVDGWSMINIGRADSTLDMYLGASTFSDPVTFLNGSRRYLYGSLTGTDNASLNFTGGWLDNNGYNLTTNGGKIDLSGMIRNSTSGSGSSTYTSNGGNILFSDLKLYQGTGITVNSGSGNISFSGVIQDESGTDGTGMNIALNSTGTISFGASANTKANIAASGNALTFNGAWGGTIGLGNVTLTSTNSITLPSITTQAGKTINATVTGAGNSIITSAITTGAVGNITLTADDLMIGGNLSGTGTLTLRPYSLTRSMRINDGTGDFNLDSAEIARFVDGWSLINIGRTDSTAGLLLGTSTWYDPVEFHTSAGRRLNTGTTLTGLGNASFNLTGSNSLLDLRGDIVTNGGAVTFGQAVYSYGSTITTNGGNVTFARTLRGAASSGNLTVNSGNGAISLFSLTDDTLNASLGKSYSFNAGTGAIAFNGVNDAAANVTANANAISFNGAWGGSAPVGNVTLTSVNALTLPSITTQAGKTVNATVSGAGNSITTSTISTGTAGNISLTADDLTIGGSLSGTGTITLQPYSTTRLMCINANASGCSSSPPLALSAAEIGYLVDGWSLINLGRTDSTGQNNGFRVGGIGSVTFTDPVAFRAGSSTVLAYVDDALIGSGNASFTFTSGLTLRLNGSITTNNQSVTASNVTFSNAPSINTNGGALSIGGKLALTNGASGSVNTAGGNISILGPIESTVSTSSAGKTLSFNTGGGSFSLPSTVNTDANISINAGSMSFNGAWGTSTALGDVSLTSANALSLPSITASSIYARSTGAAADITLGSGVVLNASGSGNVLTLVAGRNFINNAGSGALSAGSGRWLVYSTNPTDTVGEELLSSGFRRYSCSFSTVGSCAGGTVVIPASGNGLIYSYTPVLTVTPNALANLTYGAATPSLSGYGYTLAGYLAGDTGDSVTGSLTGSTSYTQGANIGTYGINYASGTLASAMGYGFSYQNNASAIHVDPRVLTAGLTGTVSKVYDGTNSASLVGGNYTLSNNIYGTDDVSLVIAASGTYADKHVGSGKQVSVSGLTLTGAGAGNYVLASTSLSANIGSISQKALTISGITSADRVYDTTNVAALNFASMLLNGTISGDSIGINSGSAQGLFADKNIGTNKTITLSGFGLSGSDAGNYSLSQPASLTASITPYILTAGLTGSTSKVYDALLGAALTGANYTLTSALGSDVVTLGYSTSGIYADKNVGSSKQVSVSGLTLTGAGAGNYVLASSSLSANIGSISQKALTISGITSADRVYDTTNVAALNFASMLLNGTISGDSIGINSGSAQGLFADKNIGTNKTITLSGFGLNGSDAGNYSLSQPASLTASITPYVLTAGLTGSTSKVYDALLGAALTGANYTLSSALGSDVVNLGYSTSGTYADKHVGSGKQVSVSGLTLTGAGAGNYVLASSSLSANIGSISQKAVSASLTGTVSKVYDGTNSASLTNGNYQVSGLIGGDDAVFQPVLSGTYADKHAGSGKQVSVSGLTLTGTDAGNYALTSSSISGAVGVISPAMLNVIANSYSKTYGDAEYALGYSYSGLVGGDTVASFTGGLTRTGSLNAGSYQVQQGSLAATGNYAIGSFTPGSYQINKAVITIAGPQLSRMYGDANAPLSWANLAISGLQYGENGSVLDTVNLYYDSAASVGANAGTTHLIGMSSFNDNNYALGGYTAGSLSITKAPLTVSPVSTSTVTGQPFPVFTADITGFRNGDTASVIQGLRLQTNATLASPVGQYALYGSGATATNYYFLYNPASFSVLPGTALVPTTVEQSLITGNINRTERSIERSTILISTPLPAAKPSATAPSGNGANKNNAVDVVPNGIFGEVNGLISYTKELIQRLAI